MAGPELVVPLVPQLTENRTVPIRTSSSTNIVRRFLPAMTTPNMPNEKIEAKIGRGPCLSSADLGGVPETVPAIVTVTAVDGIDVPSMANEVGATVQVAPAGAVHVRFNVWLKPLSGAAVTWNVAVPPVEGTLIDGLELVSVKSGEPEAPAEVPVPVSETDCGEFAAMPVTVRLPAAAAAAVGAKVT